MSRRKYTIRREAGLHLTDRQREMLGTAWNQYVNCSRRYVIEHVSHISQDDVITAIKRMKRRNALRVIRSVTTDNGCEFLDTERQRMLTIHVWPRWLKDFLLTHPLYKSPPSNARRKCGIIRNINETAQTQGVCKMACFTVPLVGAVAAGAAQKAMKKSIANPFVAHLPWLTKMAFGGSFLLAIEHVYHGEIIMTPPFLTAAKEGPEAMSEMFHEMATVGVSMAALLLVAWVGMVLVSEAVVRNAKKESANV